jgi:hypothetical protein
MSEVTVEQIADAMHELVVEMKGKKNLKPMDVIKAMQEKFGEDVVDRKTGKAAIRILIDGGRCQYSYAGGSFIVPAE